MQSTAIRLPQQGKLSDLAVQINHEHQQAEASLNDGLQHALRAGEFLAQAKVICTHGSWLPWLQREFHGSKRTAQAYMRLSREYLPRRRQGLRQQPHF